MCGEAEREREREREKEDGSSISMVTTAMQNGNAFIARPTREEEAVYTYILTIY